MLATGEGSRQQPALTSNCSIDADQPTTATKDAPGLNTVKRCQLSLSLRSIIEWIVTAKPCPQISCEGGQRNYSDASSSKIFCHFYQTYQFLCPIYRVLRLPNKLIFSSAGLPETGDPSNKTRSRLYLSQPWEKPMAEAINERPPLSTLKKSNNNEGGRKVDSFGGTNHPT